MHRDGAGRLLDGGDPIHEGAGSSTSSKGRTRRPSISSDSPRRESPGGIWAGLRSIARTPRRCRARTKKSFLKQAVSGLAQDGKVICVRLALFAEMVKGKSWTPATLKEVGGTEGVGVTFLEETFSAATAPPEHRLPPEGGTRRSEGSFARIRHRHQGPHAVIRGTARSVGLWEPPERI